MGSARLNISIPEKTLASMDKDVKPGERSKFIAEAIESLLRKRREERLARDYQEAAEEIRAVNADWEGTLGDGLDD
ncbi:MAG: hypothetical protein V1736_08375 [Pseudomonadota bacterium]